MFLKPRRNSSWGKPSRQKSIWSNGSNRYSRGPRLQFKWSWFLAGLPLALILLELLARLGVGLAGKTQAFQRYEGESELTNGYRLRYVDRSGQPYDSLPNQGKLAVRRSPLLGYRLIPNQKNGFWTINEQGMREEATISPTKPANEVRIFVLGGSTAFGQLSPNNAATFSQLLQTRLNQQVVEQRNAPGKFRPDVLSFFADEQAKELTKPPRIKEANYRVVNAAVPGYTSGNELAQLTQNILAYQPDLIVLVNGYADLVLPSTQEAADIPKIESRLDDVAEGFAAAIGENLREAISHSYLLKSIQYWILKPQERFHPVLPPTAEAVSPLAEMVSQDAQEQQRRVDRYGQNLRQFAQISQAAKIPMVVAIQPEITCRLGKSATEREKSLLNQIPANYKKSIQSGYQALGSVLEQFKKDFATQATTINLCIFYGETAGDLFADPIHLTPEGNQKLASKLHTLITPRLQVQPKPFGGTPPTTRPPEVTPL